MIFLKLFLDIIKTENKDSKYDPGEYLQQIHKFIK